MDWFAATRAFALLLTIATLVPAAAHALELPGKMRLPKQAYLTVQPIYYPGFTIAGWTEPLAIAVVLALCLVTSASNPTFWPTAIALAALAGMHAVYWLFTHPTNAVWLRRESLGAAAGRFFGAAAPESAAEAHWTRLRDRWEYSHVARAGLAAASCIALVVALALD